MTLRIYERIARATAATRILSQGTAFEQIENSNHHFVLLYHQMGTTAVLGSYDGPLADGQLADLVSGADNDGGRFRASAQLLPNGNTNLQVNVGPDSSEPRRH